jgi:hypothetical protein
MASIFVRCAILARLFRLTDDYFINTYSSVGPGTMIDLFLSLNTGSINGRPDGASTELPHPLPSRSYSYRHIAIQ